MKELYTFTVQNTTKAEDGTETSAPVKIFFKRPGASENNLLSLVYAAELSKALKMGIMSETDIRRTVQDAGGFKHSKSDKSKREKLVEQYAVAHNKRQVLLTEEKSTEKIDKKIKELENDINDLDQGLRKILETSAEVVAYNQVIKWMVSNLCFWDEDRAPVFIGETDEDREKDYYNSIDEDGLKAKVIGFAIVIAQAYIIHGYKTKEEFEELEKNFQNILDEGKC